MHTTNATTRLNAKPPAAALVFALRKKTSVWETAEGISLKKMWTTAYPYINRTMLQAINNPKRS